MSGYTKKEQKEFRKFTDELLRNKPEEPRKSKKHKRKRGLKKGEWKGAINGYK